MTTMDNYWSRVGMWAIAVLGAVLIQVVIISATVSGVEADLLQQTGSTPVWEPLGFLVGLTMLLTGIFMIRRSRRC